MIDDWFWACADGGIDILPTQPTGAGRKFIIANGQDELWRRVRSEICQNEFCVWNAVHPKNSSPILADILDMIMTVVPCYGVRKSIFAIEAAQIPIFAKFIKNARSPLCNYISNSVANIYEMYEKSEHITLGKAVNRTLSLEDEDWWGI